MGLEGQSVAMGCYVVAFAAQAVCMVIASDSPERYLNKMTKSLRGGRIYLDYLRNDPGGG